MQKSISEWTTHWFEADGQPQQKTTPGKNWTTERSVTEGIFVDHVNTVHDHSEPTG